MSRWFESGCRHKALFLPAGLTSHPPMGFDPHLIGKYGAVALVLEWRGFCCLLLLSEFNLNRADVPYYPCGAHPPQAREELLPHGQIWHGCPVAGWRDTLLLYVDLLFFISLFFLSLYLSLLSWWVRLTPVPPPGV